MMLFAENWQAKNQGFTEKGIGRKIGKYVTKRFAESMIQPQPSKKSLTFTSNACGLACRCTTSEMWEFSFVSNHTPSTRQPPTAQHGAVGDSRGAASFLFVLHV